MPNILAHAHVTRRVLDPESTDVTFGSMLPDFTNMYRARTDRRLYLVGIPGKLGAGIAFHKTTDVAFDSQPEKPDITAPLSEDLRSVGIDYGASRLAADVAGDILLDRALLDFDAPVFDYLDVGAAVLANEVDFGGLEAPFVVFVRRFFEENKVRDYAKPFNVARIIQRALNSRNDKLHRHISEDKLKDAVDVLDYHAERAGNLGLMALDATIRRLSPAWTEDEEVSIQH